MSGELLDGFRIGPYQILPREEKIVGPAHSHHVEPKVMQVLVKLAGKPNQTISRNEILEEVWSDTIVGDEVLSRAISLLRGYFQDERTKPKYIRTVPRQGYELIAPVEVGAAAPVHQHRKLRFAALAVGLLALIAIGSAVLFWPKPTEPGLTLAVMPLSTIGDQPRLAYVADGLADHLITRLTGSPTLNVVARRSSFLIRDTDANVRAIGEQLGARYIVEGSLADQDTDLLLTLYLVDTERGINLWTTQIRSNADNLADLRLSADRALSTALADKLGVKIGGAPSQQLTAIPDAAYLKYHEARYQWSLRGERRIARAIELLKEAIALAPDFAAAWRSPSR